MVNSAMKILSAGNKRWADAKKRVPKAEVTLKKARAAIVAAKNHMKGDVAKANAAIKKIMKRETWPEKSPRSPPSSSRRPSSDSSLL